MERGRHRQKQRTLGTGRFRQINGAFNGSLAARNDILRRIVLVGDLTDLALCGLCGNGLGLIKAQPQKGGHSALPHGHSRLHRAPPDAQQPRRIGKRECPRRAQGRIFTQRMARDIGRFVDGNAFGLQRRHRRH